MKLVGKMMILLVLLLVMSSCVPLHCADGLPQHRRDELGCPPQEEMVGLFAVMPQPLA